MSKTPFIDGYLDKFEEDDEIKNILSKNKCNIVHYADITEDEKQHLLEYDYAVILSHEQFNDFEVQNKSMFDKLMSHRKLLFVDEYIHEKINPLIYNIKHGFKITVNEKMKKIYLSNNLMFISVVSAMYIAHKQNLLKLNITNVLPSSIKIINISHSFSIHKKINNLPSGVIILNICDNLTMNNRIKLPKNIFFIIKAMDLAKKKFSFKYFANAFRIKTKKTKILIGRHDLKKSAHLYSITKNSNTFDFLCIDYTKHIEKVYNDDTIFTLHKETFKKNTNFFKYCLLIYNDKNDIHANILDNVCTGTTNTHYNQIIYNKKTKIFSAKNEEISKFLINIENTIDNHTFLNERYGRI